MKKTYRSPSGETAADPLAPSGLKSATPAAGASPPGTPPAAATQTGTTAWLMVFLAIFAGILAATQVGKAHIALPAIRSDLKLSLVAGSWLISAMNFLGLFGASLVGSWPPVTASGVSSHWASQTAFTSAVPAH